MEQLARQEYSRGDVIQPAPEGGEHDAKLAVSVVIVNIAVMLPLRGTFVSGSSAQEKSQPVDGCETEALLLVSPFEGAAVLGFPTACSTA